MLKPELIRELELDTEAQSHRLPWLSAASGLVCTAGLAYVVADDELSLGCFPVTQPWTQQQRGVPVQLIPVFAGELPQEQKERKKLKPDLESLLLLPSSADFPNGALLTLGSGSRPNRCRAVMLGLDAKGRVAGKRHAFDLAELYEPLHKHFNEPNIEGVFISGTQLRLLQRGNNGRHNISACISYDYQHFIDWALKARHHPPAIQIIAPLDFGSVGGVPLSPTDAVALPAGGWIVSLVAEATDDSYQDGICVGSALAVMDADDRLSQLHMLAQGPKVEGLALLAHHDKRFVDLLMVTDADTPELPAQLLRVSLPAN